MYFIWVRSLPFAMAKPSPLSHLRKNLYEPRNLKKAAPQRALPQRFRVT